MAMVLELAIRPSGNTLFWQLRTNFDTTTASQYGRYVWVSVEFWYCLDGQTDVRTPYGHMMTKKYIGKKDTIFSNPWCSANAVYPQNSAKNYYFYSVPLWIGVSLFQVRINKAIVTLYSF